MNEKYIMISIPQLLFDTTRFMIFMVSPIDNEKCRRQFVCEITMPAYFTHPCFEW